MVQPLFVVAQKSLVEPESLQQLVDKCTDELVVELVVEDGRISVRDHGPGIGDQTDEKLFARFSRGTAGASTGSGTGLGLAIARELARRWKAEVTLENADGGGAVATIEFIAAGEERAS